MESELVLFNLSPGRKLEDLADAMGLYAKYLPVVRRCEDEPFVSHLRNVHRALAETDEWQEYFDPATWINTLRDSVGFDFEDRQIRSDPAELSFSVIDQHVRLSPFKLKLSCVRCGATLSGELGYDTQIFDQETIKQFAGYLAHFLSDVVQHPDRRLSEIEITAADELLRSLADLNQTTIEIAPESINKTVHELFEAQVSKTPTAPALVSEDQELTFEELNTRANQLAHWLRRRGVGPDVCVGLCMERSAELIVGMLGILKAGGAYVPLNPDHPQERLEIQLRESQSLLLVTDGGQKLDFAGETFDLQRDGAMLAAESGDNPQPAATAENLVYVIYTSGSTGVPKGVAVRHRNLANYTQSILQLLEVDRPLAFATVSTISADLGNTCIFPSLVSGGCLHLISYDVAMEGALLSGYVAKRPIDVLKIVPSHLSALLAAPHHDILPRKYLLLGGEALSWELVDRISQTNPACKIINHYGPTETTVGSLTFGVKPNEVSTHSLTVPIGQPIANTSVYILDRHLKPVPTGVAGELYIGGAGLADGYLNQPIETAARFVLNPFSDKPDARLYRTGDLARYLPEGDIEFLGRIDHQVKVRGFRVELAEIETVLLMHNEVREAVVVAEAATTENQRLVGYVVASASKPPGIDELRTFLGRRLPAYMIPSTFVFLKTMPLTPNGKIDRASLPSPDDARPGLQRLFVAPRTPIEKELAGIWAELLKLNEVGVEDSFFELGGHSLLATQVVSRMRKTFNCEIPLRSLFESPTIAQLAQQIAASRAIESERLLAEIEKLSDEEVETMLKTKEP
jgi:amino acid adenylation domain-containing protein